MMPLAASAILMGQSISEAKNAMYIRQMDCNHVGL